MIAYLVVVLILGGGLFIRATRAPVDVTLVSQDVIGEVSVNCAGHHALKGRSRTIDLGWLAGDDFVVIQAHTDKAGADFDAIVRTGDRVWEAAPGDKRMRLGATIGRYIYFYALTGTGEHLGEVPCKDIVPALGFPPAFLAGRDPPSAFWTGPFPGLLAGAASLIAVIATMIGFGLMIRHRREFLWWLPWLALIGGSLLSGLALDKVLLAGLTILGLIAVAPVALKAAGLAFSRKDSQD